MTPHSALGILEQELAGEDDKNCPLSKETLDALDVLWRYVLAGRRAAA